MGIIDGIIGVLRGGKKPTGDMVQQPILAIPEYESLLKLLDAHMRRYQYEEKIARLINFANYKRTIEEGKLNEVLDSIESSTKTDLVEEAEEEKDEQKLEVRVLQEMQDIISEETGNNIERREIDIRRELRLKTQQDILFLQESIDEAFRQIRKLLRLKIELILLIRKDPTNSSDKITGLFRLIYHREGSLYKLFNAEIREILRKMLAGEGLTYGRLSKEERSVYDLARMMGTDDGNTSRMLAEKIYNYLAEHAWDKLGYPKDTNISVYRIEVEQRISLWIYKDAAMKKAVRNSASRFLSGGRIMQIIRAFRRAYERRRLDRIRVIVIAINPPPEQEYGWTKNDLR
jgi:hypothetical protein